MMSTPLNSLQNRLRYTFGDRALLLQALTHRSFGHENFPEKPASQRDNERLEFLGDAILDLVVSDLLLESFPDANEGQLSKMRAAVVNEKTLAEVARSVGLMDCLRLGKGEAQSGGREKASILSSTIEAVVAAVYLDGGFHAVYPVLRYLFAPILSPEVSGLSFQDHKTKLQEHVQAQFRVTPSYILLRAEGPDHAKVFEVSVNMQWKSSVRVLGTARGSSKKEAEQNAARAAWDLLSQEVLSQEV